MSWFRQVFRRRNIYRDLADEVREHLEERTEQIMRVQGLGRRDAELAARKAFGNATLIEQRGREVWQWPSLESIWADVRFALRQMRKAPSFAFTVVLLIGLGIGAITAVFSLVDAVLLRPVPYPDPPTLVIPWNIPPPGVDVGFAETPWSPIQFQAMEQETGTYRFLGAFEGQNFNLTGAGDAAMLEGARVSWGFFLRLGCSPSWAGSLRVRKMRRGTNGR